MPPGYRHSRITDGGIPPLQGWEEVKLYDSSVLIDYLDGVDEAIKCVTRNAGERAVAPPLVLFEVYQGEVYRPDRTDLDAVDGALEWLTVVNGTAYFARGAAELQDELQQRGTPLSARDAFVAGTAECLASRSPSRILTSTSTDFVKSLT